MNHQDLLKKFATALESRLLRFEAAEESHDNDLCLAVPCTNPECLKRIGTPHEHIV
jgi:hypothetical protein